MSTINLSEDLLNEIQQVLEKHDEKNKDIGIGAQYIAAILGVLVAHFPGESAQKKAFLQQLFQFSDQVLTSNLEPEQPEQPNNEESFGIWKPGDK